MSRPIDTFFQRIAQVRHFPPAARVAALAAGLSVCSAEEARALVPELIELAAQGSPDPFASPASAVRFNPLNWLKNRRVAAQRRVADAALEALIRHWDRVPADLVPLVAGAGRGRFGVAGEASTDSDPAVRANVVAAAGELGEGQLARLVGHMLADADTSVAKAAEHALVHMALGEFARTGTGEACLDPRLVEQLWRVRVVAEFGFSREIRTDYRSVAGEAPGPHGAASSRDGVIEGVVTACEAFDRHRRRGVLVCAMLLLDRARLASLSPRRAAITDVRPSPDRLALWFSRPVTDAHSVLRTVLRASVLPVAGLRAMEWVGVEPWTRACSERLSRGGTVLEHELVLASAHLALRPRRAAALARIGIKSRPGARSPLHAREEPRNTGARELELGILPDVAIVNSLSTDAGRGAARMVGVVSAAAPDRELAARSFLAHADPVARHSVMRAMPGSGLSDWVFDGNEQISAGAALRMSRADDPRAAEADEGGLAWWRQLARVPQPRTRFLAEEELAQRADAISGTLRGRLWASRHMAKEPERFVAAIGESLGDAERQPGAIMLLRRLGLAPTFQQQLVDLALQAPDARVAATAVAALADLSGARAMDAAVASLGHADARVRANAVEAIGRRVRAGEALPMQVMELKHDGNHRVRANAVRLEMGSAAVAGELAAMLRDERPEHRLAGAWLTSRALGGGGLKPRLGADADQLALRLVELASGDPDDRVRRRAAIGASRVMGELRASWRLGGPGSAGGPAMLAGGTG